MNCSPVSGSCTHTRPACGNSHSRGSLICAATTSCLAATARNECSQAELVVRKSDTTMTNARCAMRAALPRRQVLFDMIGNQHEPDFVLVLDRTEREYRGDLGGALAFAILLAAVVRRATDIHNQQNRQLTFFNVLAHVGIVHPRGD